MEVWVFQNQLRSFEKPAVDFWTLFGLVFVENGLAEVNHSHFLSVKFIENILRFYISMYHSSFVKVIEDLQEVFHVHFQRLRVEFSVILFKVIKIVMLKHKRVNVSNRVLESFSEFLNMRDTFEVIKYLNFSHKSFNATRFQHFDCEVFIIF